MGPIERKISQKNESQQNHWSITISQKIDVYFVRFLRLLHDFLQLFFAVPLKTAVIYKTVKCQGGGAHRTENITKKTNPSKRIEAISLVKRCIQFVVDKIGLLREWNVHWLTPTVVLYLYEMISVAQSCLRVFGGLISRASDTVVGRTFVGV